VNTGATPKNKLLLLLLCALLSGASGLGLEVLITHSAGLTLGYGKAGPIAIAVYIAGWAFGALEASTWRTASRGQIRGLGVAVLVGAFMLADLKGMFDNWFVLILATLIVAIPQGMFLPILVRAQGDERSKEVSWLFAANLLGAGLGAHVLGSLWPAAYGLKWAGYAAAGVACVAAVLTSLGYEPRESESGDEEDYPGGPVGGASPGWKLGLVVAGVTAWATTLQWFGVRLGVLWLGGMQDALGSVLVATMIALSLGAAVLPRLLPKGSMGIAVLTLLCCASSLSYFFLPQWMESVAEAPLYLRSLALVGPTLLPFGAWIPVLQARVDGADAGTLGQLLGYEAFGALLGLPLMHFLVLPTIGINGTVLAMLGVALCGSFFVRPRWIGGLGVLASLALVFALDLQNRHPVLQSPPMQNPAFEVLAFHEDEHFAVSVVNDGLLGERTLMTDGFRAAANGHDYGYMRALAHLPMLLHPDPQRVGVLAFGTGTTAGALSMYENMERLDVLELSETVIANAGHFESVNRGVLQDPRVNVLIGDGRHTLRNAPGTYEVLTMEPLLPDSPFAVYLYTSEFYEEAKEALKPGGLLCQWVPPHALEPETFDAVVAAFTSAFEWSGVWLFGTQVILLGGAHQPELTPARFPQPASELGSALASLGLNDVVGVAGRYITSGDNWPDVSRPLIDSDPWVIYQPRRRGSVLLADLPLNLAKLRRSSQTVPNSWLKGGGPETANRLLALSLLRRVREATESERALASIQSETAALPERTASLTECRNRLLAETEFESANELMNRVRQLAPREPGLLRLDAAVEFQQSMRAGFGLLASGAGQESAGDAAMQLMRAVVLRPERADARAYLALALQRLGSERAADEIGNAIGLCPNLRNTTPGSRITKLGFDWSASIASGAVRSAQ
jgi:spermidine synthase